MPGARVSLKRAADLVGNPAAIEFAGLGVHCLPVDETGHARRVETQPVFNGGKGRVRMPVTPAGRVNHEVDSGSMSPANLGT